MCPILSLPFVLHFVLPSGDLFRILFGRPSSASILPKCPCPAALLISAIIAAVLPSTSYENRKQRPCSDWTTVRELADVRYDMCRTNETVIFVLFNLIYESLYQPFNTVAKLYIEKKHHRLNLKADSEGFWRWCRTLRITGFLDFDHRPVF
jgi:hypothetical protein